MLDFFFNVTQENYWCSFTVRTAFVFDSVAWVCALTKVPSKNMIQKHHHEANTQILYVSKIDLIALFLTTLKQKLT